MKCDGKCSTMWNINYRKTHIAHVKKKSRPNSCYLHFLQTSIVSQLLRRGLCLLAAALLNTALSPTSPSSTRKTLAARQEPITTRYLTR